MKKFVWFLRNIDSLKMQLCGCSQELSNRSARTIWQLGGDCQNNVAKRYSASNFDIPTVT